VEMNGVERMGDDKRSEEKERGGRVEQIVW
jgi:hypothetical protein